MKVGEAGSPWRESAGETMETSWDTFSSCRHLRLQCPFRFGRVQKTTLFMLWVTKSWGLLTVKVGEGEAARKTMGGKGGGSPRGEREAGSPWREAAGEAMETS